MKIGVIGAGSIGLLFAAYFSGANLVTLYTRTSEQAGEINENGICLVKKDKSIKFNIKAYPLAEWSARDDLTIVAVKQYQLPAIMKWLKEREDQPINTLFLQNGMGHLKLFSDFTSGNIYVGSVEHGAFRENAFTVRHNGAGVTNLAAFRGDITLLYPLADPDIPDFPIAFHQDYYQMLLNKLIINAVINPITALLQVQNGVLLKNEHYFKAARQLFLEINNILNLANPAEYWERVVQVCRQTANNRSSMLKDIETGSTTEIDAILGFLMEAAEQRQMKAPIVTSYYYLLKGKETAPS